ncbi:MAG: LamG-like jellyroll fold domain-containing protein, partial [Planctomycetota bacterium]
DGGWVTAHADVGEEFNGEWHHAAGTFDGEQLIIYVDGEEAVSVDYEGVGIVSNAYNVAIGTNTQAGGRFSEGIHDEVMIYNKALSAGEISFLAGNRVNLLQNPSFEEDEAILDDPDWFQWVTWNPAEGAGSNATIVDTEAADGARSLLVEPIGAANWHFIVLYMPIATEVGAGYTTTFWAKAAEPRPLGVQYKATDNSVQWGFAEFNLTTEWAEYSLTAEAQNGETKLEFFCAGVEVPLWLDSVSVTEE